MTERAQMNCINEGLQIGCSVLRARGPYEQAEEPARAEGQVVSHNLAGCNTISIAAIQKRITISEEDRCQSLQSRSAFRLRSEKPSRRRLRKPECLSVIGSGRQPRRRFQSTSNEASPRRGSQGGHQGNDEMAEKACTRCKVVKPLEEFYTSRKAKDGRSSGCRACLRANYSDARQRMPGYMCWREMNSRCRNPKAKSWPEYGARGIRVYPEWQGKGGYERFIAYIGPRPTPKHQIDRIDNNRGYEPGNVRWALPVVNMRNRSNTRRLTWNGETKTVGEWAEQVGENWAVIGRRLRQGWSPEECLFGRPRKKRA